MNEEYLQKLHGHLGIEKDYNTWVNSVKDNDEYLQGLHGHLGIEKDFATWKSSVWGSPAPEVPKGEVAEVVGESDSTSASTASLSDSNEPKETPKYRIPTEDELAQAYEDSFVEIKGGVKIPKGNVIDLDKERARSRETLTDITDDLDKKQQLSEYADVAKLVGVDVPEDRVLRFRRLNQDMGVENQPDYAEMVKGEITQKVADAPLSSETFEDPYKNYPQYRDNNYTEIEVYNIFNAESGELDGIEDPQDFADFLVKTGAAAKYDREIAPHYDRGDYLYSAGDTQVQAYKHKLLTDYWNTKRLGGARDYEILAARGDVKGEDNNEQMQEIREKLNSDTKQMLGQIDKFIDLKQRFEENIKKEREWEEYLRGDDLNIGMELEYYGSSAWNSVSKILLGTVGSTLDMIGDIAENPMGAPDSIVEKDYNIFHSSAAATDTIFDMVSVDMPNLQKTYLSYKPVNYKGQNFQVDTDTDAIYQDGILVRDLDEATQKEIVKQSRGVEETESTISGRATTTGTMNMITQLYMMVKTAKALPIKNYSASAGFAGVLQTHHDNYVSAKAELEEGIASGQLDMPIEDVDGLAKMNAYLNDVVIFSAGALSPNRPLANISSPIQLAKELYKKDLSTTIGKRLSTYGGNVLKESLKELAQEETELVVSKNINALTNILAGETLMDTELRKSEVAETALVTLLGTGISTGVMQRGQLFNENPSLQLYKNAVKLSKIDTPTIQKAMDRAVKSGDLNQSQVDALNKTLLNIAKFDGKIPKDIESDEVRQALLPLLQKREELKQAEANSDPAFKEKFKSEQEKLTEQINSKVNEKATTDGSGQTQNEVETGAEDATPETVQTESAEEIGSIKEIEKIDLSESLGINKVESIIDNLDKQLKDFGDQTLGINMPVAVARVALKGMKGAVAGSRLTADLVSAGVNAVMETSWYKNLSKPQKDDFHKKGLMNLLGEMETTLRKGSQPTTKKNKDFRNKVKEVTGQTDTSKKITISEKRLNKKMMQLAEREGKTGERVGRKEIMEAKKEAIKKINESVKPLVKKYKDNALYAKAYSRALSAVNQYNGKNIDKVNEAIDKIEAIIEKEGKAKELRKSIKKAKSNVKKTGVASGAVRSILRYDPSWITDEKDIERYKEILDKFNTGENFDINETQDFFNEIQDKYFDTIPEKKPREQRPANYDEKNELADNLINLKKVKKDMLTPEEVSMVNDFLKIPLDYYDNLKDTEVRALNRALNKFNQSGIIPAKVLFEHSAKAVGKEVAKELSGTLGGKLLTVRGNALDAVKRIFGKNKDYTSDEILSKVNNRMLHHIDNVITNFKGYKLYQQVIHPLTSKMTKADNEASQIESQLLDLIAKAKTSVEGSRLKRLKPSVLKAMNIGDTFRYETELSIKAQLLFRHKEYEANKEFSNKTKGVAKVYSVDEHIAAMNNDNLSTNYRNGQKDIDAVNRVYNKFTDSDGNFDVTKLEKSLTKEEVKLLNFMQSTIANMTTQSMFTNTHVRGESLTMMNNYFPRKSAMNNSKDVDALDMTIQRMTSQVSMKDSSSNERAATKAEPLDFNTFNNFLRYVKGATLENNVLPELKKVNEMNASLIRMGGQEKLLGEVLSQTVENTVKAKQFGSSVKDTKLEKAFKVFQKNTFNKLLIDPFRFTVDILTNQGLTAFANLYRAGKIKNAVKNIDNDLMKKMAKDLGSIHYERIANYHAVLGDSAIDYRQTALGALAKARYGTTGQTLGGNALELIQKNVLSDFGDIAAIKYYQLVDSIAKPLWATELFENFKKSTGIEINASNYDMIKEEYKKELADALALADKETSNVFNTVSTSEQKLDLQLRESNDLKKMVDAFMKSFAFNENSTLWDSIISLGSMGKKGNMTVEQATRNFFILTSRSIAYSFLTQVMLQWVWQLAFDGEEEEELEEKALERALAQHSSLLLLGNYGNLVNMIGNLLFTAGQEMYTVSEGEDFNQFEDGLLYSLSDRGKPSSYAKSLGAAGETFSTLVLKPIETATEIGLKWAENGEITKEDLINAKAAGLTLNLISQMTGISTYRLGKIMDKELKESIK